MTAASVRGNDVSDRNVHRFCYCCGDQAPPDVLLDFAATELEVPKVCFWSRSLKFSSIGEEMCQEAAEEVTRG